VLVQKWDAEANGESFNIFPDCTSLTLDIIGLCAFSRDFDSLNNPTSEYVKSVSVATELVYKRVISIFLFSNFLYYSTREGKEFKKATEIMHDFTMKVIKQRRDETKEEELNPESKKKTSFY